MPMREPGLEENLSHEALGILRRGWPDEFERFAKAFPQATALAVFGPIHT